MVKKLQDEAARLGTKARIYLSLTQDHERNPLAPEQKLAFVQAAFPEVEVKLAKTVFDACLDMGKEGAKQAIMVVGEDRAERFTRILPAYHGTDALGLDSVDVRVVSRDADDASATQARQAALEGDWPAFQDLSPSSDATLTRSLYEAVRNGLGV